jgi:flagellar biosynthesis GTPase FlhF
MRIKRIEAVTVAEAMRRLREDLGDNALILHTKTITAPGVAGFFKRSRVEILGAVDEALAARDARSATDVETAHVAAVRADSPPDPLADSRHPAASARPVTSHVPFDWTRSGRGPRRVVFVGPTGAGKTTTLAKVAARARLDHGQRVALVTIDTYRIGAVPQLASYADILGVPLSVAHTAAEAGDAIARAEDADFVFIDTTGRSPLGSGVDGLKPFLEAAAPDITYLVLSAITRTRDALRAAASYSRLTPNALCVTRLDETDDYQSLTEVAHTTGLPLAWLGVGQEVPDDIREADAASMAALARGGHAA